jgi:hypothetical protein
MSFVLNANAVARVTKALRAMQAILSCSARYRIQHAMLGDAAPSLAGTLHPKRHSGALKWLRMRLEQTQLVSPLVSVLLDQCYRHLSKMKLVSAISRRVWAGPYELHCLTTNTSAYLCSRFTQQGRDGGSHDRCDKHGSHIMPQC